MLVKDEFFYMNSGIENRSKSMVSHLQYTTVWIQINLLEG